MMGRMEARGISPLLQWLACALIRMTHNAAGTAFFIWVILGGLDAYAGSYDALFARLPGLPSGETAALVLTAVSLAVWTVGATAAQVVVYRRGMARWPADGADTVAGRSAPATGCGSPAARPSSHRFDPRAVTLAAAIAFALLVSSTDWALLGGVTAWLVLAAAVTSTADRGVVATGAGLAAILAGGALVAGLVSGLGADLALRRALRAALLVLVATWLRAAAGSDGVREVARRVLGRLGRIPAMAEAAEVLDRLGSDRRLAVAGRSLQAALSAVPKRPLPVLDALLGWVAVHSSDFVPDRQGPRLRLEARPLDALLVALAAVPVLALASALPAS
jgi:hypothetical protein